MPFLLVVLAGLLLAAGAQAVHDDGIFALEGNAITGGTQCTNAAQTQPSGCEPANPNSQGYFDEDWDKIYADSSKPKAQWESGADEISFATDPVNGNDDILTGGGTKDIHDLSSWAWKTGANVKPQDKADIGNAYAAQYGDHLYFGADRYANSGDTVMGFWFFRKEIGKVGPDAQGNGTFTGTHTARQTGCVPITTCDRGDVLVVSDFRNGGKAPVIKVYEWVSSGGSASTNLDLIGGSDDPASCTQAPGEKPNDPPVPPVGNNDPFCATANQFVVTSPWPFTAKANTGGTSGPGGANTKFGVAMFMEGGIDLGFFGFGDTCFSTFMAETRASHSVTSTLSDFVLKGFGECESSLVTTPKRADGTTNVGNDLSIGTGGSVQVRDSAVLTIGGVSTWSGNLKFFLCAPAELTPANTGTCTTGGTRIQGQAEPNDGIPVTNSTPQPIVSAAATVTAAANLTAGAPGRYCWRGEFTATTPGVPPATDASAGECFIVNPVQPELSTQAIDGQGNNLTAAVPFNQPIFDKATLSGTAKKPGSPIVNPSVAGLNAGGTITFRLYGPSPTTTPTTEQCNTLAAGFATAFPNGIQRTVNGDGNYTTIGDGFTPASPGYYFWKAEYSGDDPNTLGATHNANCGDANERVQVLQLNPAITTAQSFVPNDAATITVGSGGGNLEGSVVFKLYVNNLTCTGTPAYTSDPIDITSGQPNPGTAGLSKTVVSNNATAYDASGTTNFRWVVEYTSTNSAHTGVTSPCGKEISSITINNNAS